DRTLLDRSWGAQQLLRLLLRNMEVSAGGRLISSYWPLADLEALDLKDGDHEGMINQLYCTEGIEVAVLFVEKNSKEVKLSFRSKGNFNVAAFARSIDPNVGGHVRAAGCG